MADLDLILSRLDGGGWEALSAALVDHLLDRPVADLVDPALIADLVVTTLEATVENPTTDAWIRRRINELRERVPAGRLRGRVPDDIVGPLEALLERPYPPDQQLVRRLLRHEAVERLFKDTLVAGIASFARKLRAPPVGHSALRGLGRLKDSFGEGMRESLLGGLSHELERQAETKAREYVDGAIQAVMDEVARHLCAPEHAARQGAWRVYVVETFLDLDLSTLAGELDKLDPDSLVDTARAILRALVRRGELRDEIRAGLTTLAREAGDRPVRATLAEAGLEEGAWRPGMEAMLTREARSFGGSPAFRAWLGRMVEDPDATPDAREEL